MLQGVKNVYPGTNGPKINCPILIYWWIKLQAELLRFALVFATISVALYVRSEPRRRTWLLASRAGQSAVVTVRPHHAAGKPFSCSVAVPRSGDKVTIFF